MKSIYYLNFTDLSKETQNYLIQKSIKDLEEKYGKKNLEKEAQEINLSYNDFIMEKAEEHIYSFNFRFNI
jgi:cell division protein FtsL